jgi:hypothetical protein
MANLFKCSQLQQDQIVNLDHVTTISFDDTTHGINFQLAQYSGGARVVYWRYDDGQAYHRDKLSLGNHCLGLKPY